MRMQRSYKVVSGGFRGGKGVQMNPPFVPSNV